MNNNCSKQYKCKDKIYVIGTPGPKGKDGTGTITIGSTTTGAAGTNASVTNSGTVENAILNFTIPRGETGLQGPIGPTGPAGPAGTSVTNTYGGKYDATGNTITLTENIVSTVPLSQTTLVNGITSSTNSLTINTNGVYKIDYYFQGSSNNNGTVTVAIYKSNETINGSDISVDLETNKEQIINGSVITSLEANDVITLGLESTSALEISPAANTNAYLIITRLA